MKNTIYDLQLLLQRIDDKVHSLTLSNVDGAPSAMIDLSNERQVTERCLRICRDAQSYCESLPRRNASILKETPQGRCKDEFRHESEPPALDVPMNASYFEKHRVSSMVSADTATEFFETNGIFYEANAEIGHQAAALKREKYSVQHLQRFNTLIRKDEVSLLSSLLAIANRKKRLATILEPFLAKEPLFCMPIGADKGNFYSLTIQRDQGHRAIIYVFRPGTHIEFSIGSHDGPAKGVPSSNGQVHRPHVHLARTRGLEDFGIDMEEGGM